MPSVIDVTASGCSRGTIGSNGAPDGPKPPGGGGPYPAGGQGSALAPVSDMPAMIASPPT
jgi:hypothetical protein